MEGVKIKVCTPERVTLDELHRRQAEDAARFPGRRFPPPASLDPSADSASFRSLHVSFIPAQPSPAPLPDSASAASPSVFPGLTGSTVPPAVVPPCPVPAPTAVPLPTCSASVPSHAPCSACPHLDHSPRFELARQAAYWKSMHTRAVAREQELLDRIAELEAKLRLREQQLFGTKSESSSTIDQLPTAGTTAAGTAGTTPPTPKKKPRGHQRGTPGHGRRNHSHLPAVEEVLDVPADQQVCSCCGKPFEPFAGTEDSELIEIKVQAYRRVIRRRRYRRSCSCPQQPGIITAPPAPRVIPKGILGISVWVDILLDKFLYYRPTYRLLDEWRERKLNLSLGTVTEGMHRLLPLFEPIYQELVAHNQKQKHWHADETRWLVFQIVEGKQGYRWFLWLFQSAEAVVFVLSSGRAHDVPEEHFEPVTQGILSVDRYVAYKIIKQVREGLIILAFCWAHQRRDFIKLAKAWPKEEAWALGWIKRIGELYAANDARLEIADRQTQQYKEKDRQLREVLKQMQEEMKKELAEPKLHPGREKVLTSLQEHWEGLTVFVENPEVPMDNNAAERTVRGPVVLRKNSYGSGAEWAGQLAAKLFSIFQTLRLWEINPREWLREYLEACARAGGKPPDNVAEFLPWKMSEEQRKKWQEKKGTQPSDEG